MGDGHRHTGSCSLCKELLRPQPGCTSALSDLCDKGYRSAGGPDALADVAQEYGGTCIVLLSIPGINVRADSVEFAGE